MKSFLRKFYPLSIINSIKNYKILSFDFAHLKTIKGGCVDKNDGFIPWYTYPAIEYIKQFDFSDKTVFEFGSGNSTLFWANRCLRAISIEDNSEWFDKMKPVLSKNVDYRFFREKSEYVKSISECPGEFDIIIIDGNHRYECAIEALKKLKDDGIIILDNSDWHQKTAELLRDADLIEVDMSGFGPINGYTWTTSFFLSRQVKLKPLHKNQPISGIGAIVLVDSYI